MEQAIVWQLRSSGHITADAILSVMTWPRPESFFNKQRKRQGLNDYRTRDIVLAGLDCESEACAISMIESGRTLGIFPDRKYSLSQTWMSEPWQSAI
jgi:hypothetical protein